MTETWFSRIKKVADKPEEYLSPENKEIAGGVSEFFTQAVEDIPDIFQDYAKDRSFPKLEKEIRELISYAQAFLPDGDDDPDDFILAEGAIIRFETRLKSHINTYAQSDLLTEQEASLLHTECKFLYPKKQPNADNRMAADETPFLKEEIREVSMENFSTNMKYIGLRINNIFNDFNEIEHINPQRVLVEEIKLIVLDIKAAYEQIPDFHEEQDVYLKYNKIVELLQEKTFYLLQKKKITKETFNEIGDHMKILEGRPPKQLEYKGE